MFTLVVIIHVVTCFLLVCTVLLQKGKGAEIGAVFGGSEAIFGPAGPTTFLGKATSVLAVVFMLTSITLTYMASHRGSASVMEGVKATAPAPPSRSTLPPPAPEAPESPAGPQGKPSAK